MEVKAFSLDVPMMGSRCTGRLAAVVQACAADAPIDTRQAGVIPTMRRFARKQEMSMRTRIALVLAAVCLVTSATAVAQADQDHAAHHPASAASASGAKAAKATKPKAPAAAPAPTAMQMDARMQSMHEMHDKMMAAKSPEERQALMADHMKAMQDGMAMMGRMQGGTMGGGMSGSQHEMMERRMDMMQMMMQMMMDREGAMAPAER